MHIYTSIDTSPPIGGPNIVKIYMGCQRYVQLEAEPSGENVTVYGRNSKESWQHEMSFDELERRLRP